MSTAKENPCRKFQANFFNKSKCQNCFKPRELHLLTDQDLTQVSNACYEYNIKISYIQMPKRTIILPIHELLLQNKSLSTESILTAAVF